MTEPARGRSSPRREQALKYLSGLFAQARSSGKLRLRDITRLAQSAGVSRDTMWRAVVQLRDQGLIATRHRAGITVQPGSGGPARVIAPGSTQPKVFTQQWERVHARIAGDILAGAYAPDSRLPGAKQLLSRYATSHRTLRKALAGAAAEGYLAEDRRWFRVAVPRIPERRSEVVLVCRGETNDRAQSRNVELLRTLERACTGAGVHLRTMPYAFLPSGELVGPDGTGAVAPGSFGRDETLGFVVWTRGLHALGLPGFLRSLWSLGKPVAVLDENGTVDWAKAGLLSRLVRVFTLGLGSRCGERALPAAAGPGTP